MIGRVIEIAGDGRHLSRSHGLMVVSSEGAEEGRVPLDDIGVLLCNARGLIYSNDLMTELARRRRQFPAGGMDLAVRRPPRAGVENALPTGILTSSTETVMAVPGQGEGRPTKQCVGSAGNVRRPPGKAGPAGEVR